MDHLIFVDTNILLDFYRAKNEASLKLLHHLDKLHECLITSYQVEMEFQNRQEVLKKSYNELKPPETITVPGFFFRRPEGSSALRMSQGRPQARESDET